MKKKIGGIAPVCYCALAICVVYYVLNNRFTPGKLLDFLALVALPCFISGDVEGYPQAGR